MVSWLGFAGSGSPGALQMKSPDGLSPLTGLKWWLESLAWNVPLPLPSGETGDGDVPRSQCSAGSQPGVVAGSVPSHCSMKTFGMPVKPENETSWYCGLPAPVTRPVERIARRGADAPAEDGGGDQQSAGDRPTHDRQNFRQPSHESPFGVGSCGAWNGRLGQSTGPRPPLNGAPDVLRTCWAEFIRCAAGLSETPHRSGASTRSRSSSTRRTRRPRAVPPRRRSLPPCTGGADTRTRPTRGRTRGPRDRPPG